MNNSAANSTDMKSAKTKPNLSFVALITQVIEQSPSRMCRLRDIYNFISNNYPYFEPNDSRWKNSIRHSLSFNDCFVKLSHKLFANNDASNVARGDLWTLHQEAGQMFEQGGFLRRHKKFVDSNKKRSTNSRASSGIRSTDSISLASSPVDGSIQDRISPNSDFLAPCVNSSNNYYYAPPNMTMNYDTSQYHQIQTVPKFSGMDNAYYNQAPVDCQFWHNSYSYPSSMMTPLPFNYSSQYIEDTAMRSYL